MLSDGSDDSGRTVHADSAELNALMEAAARHMFMKPHMGGNGKHYARVISGPTDIEGHEGHDGQVCHRSVAAVASLTPIVALF